ncbi:Uncharacterized protein dnm_055270 [Desulfonema magnum]|uniref:Uncharacterized protein n=1 Tax=Desulfonema magnum TaxID=45655 RepID=A0A975GPX9_9BACT|nr:Uncharacterized protein dnm_055270 [Desulfonema magnum]
MPPCGIWRGACEPVAANMPPLQGLIGHPLNPSEKIEYYASPNIFLKNLFYILSIIHISKFFVVLFLENYKKLSELQEWLVRKGSRREKYPFLSAISRQKLTEMADKRRIRRVKKLLYDLDSMSFLKI